MKQNGLTLIEILVVVAIVSLLATLAGVEYAGWVRKYNAETQIRTLHSDMMEARVSAMQKNVLHLFGLSGNSYSVCEDGNLDSSCDAGRTISRLSKSNLKHTLNMGSERRRKRGLLRPEGPLDGERSHPHRCE